MEQNQLIEQEPKSYNKILFISIGAVIILIIISLFIIFLTRNNNNLEGELFENSPESQSSSNNQDSLNEQNPSDEQNSSSSEIPLAQQKLISCLQGDFNLECEELFKDSDISNSCKELNELNNLKDECFHQAAIMNIDEDLCKEINDNVLKEGCEMNVALLKLEEPPI